MSFNFPAAPAVNDVWTDTVTGLSYTWDGAMWKMGLPASTTNPYVLKAGDTMLGPLVLIDPNPVAPLHSAHKRYVDEMVATMALWQGSYQVASNVPDLAVAVAAPLHGFSWTATTVDPNVPEVAVAGLPGIGGLTIASNDTIIYNDTTAAYELIRTPLMSATIAIQDGPPAAPFHGQTWWDSDNGKYYVYYQDVDSGAWVQMSGGGGSTKAEVYFGDTAPTPTFSGELWWDTSTGNMMINYNGTWVQTNVEEAPQDGQLYARQDGAWAVTTLVSGSPGEFLPLTGGTLEGALLMNPGIAVNFKDATYGISASTNFDFNCPTGVDYRFYLAGATKLRIRANDVHFDVGAFVSGGNKITFNDANHSIQWDNTGMRYNGSQCHRMYVGSTQVAYFDQYGLTDLALASAATELGVELGVEGGVIISEAITALLAKIKQLEARIARFEDL